MPRILEYLAHAALLDDLAGVHHEHPVGEARDHAEIVRDEITAIPVCSRSRELGQDLGLDGHVERGRRLVGHEQPR